MRRVILILVMLISLSMLRAQTIKIDGLNFKIVNDSEAAFIGYDDSLLRPATPDDEVGRNTYVVDSLAIPAFIKVDGNQYRISSLSTQSIHGIIFNLILPYTIVKFDWYALSDVYIKNLMCQGAFPPEARCESFGELASYELVQSFISTVIERIVVPELSVTRYKSAPCWSKYSWVIEGDKDLFGQSFGDSVFEEDGWVFNKLCTERDNKVELCYRVRKEEEMGCALSIPDSITHVGEQYAVDRIGNECFYDANYSSIFVPATVRTLGIGSFGNCHAKEITGMAGVETLELKCFFSNYLERLVFPPKMSVVPSFCIGARNGMNLQYLELHEGIISVPVDAFNYVRLNEVVSRSVIPPTTNEDSFIECKYGKLYVPGQSIEAYKVAPGWKHFDIYAIPGTAIDAITTDETPAEYYTLQGVRISVESLTPGIYIKRQGAKVEKFIR